MTLAANQVTIPAQDVGELLHQLRKVAKQLVAAEFKEFTGIIGELAACERFKYSWTPSTGYDATDKDGNRIQIKTRKVWSSPNPTQGRISKFGRKTKYKVEYEFEIGILVLLDDEFEIAEVWQLNSDEIRKRESREDGRLLPLHFSTFIAKPIKQHYHEDLKAVKLKLGWK